VLPGGRTEASTKSVKADSPTKEELLMRRRYAASGDSCRTTYAVAGASNLTVLRDSASSGQIAIYSQVTHSLTRVAGRC